MKYHAINHAVTPLQIVSYGQPARPSSAPTEPPARPLPEVIDSILRNLEMARDCTALKLASLKPGSSAQKSTAGYLRGIQEAIACVKSEGGRQ